MYSEYYSELAVVSEILLEPIYSGSGLKTNVAFNTVLLFSEKKF